MIIGDGVILGGGGETATIVVTAPTGSTVTLSRGGKVTTGTEVSGTWTFKAREYGAYTLTATKDGETATQDVVVDTATVFEVEMSYSVPLSDLPVGSIVTIKISGTPENFIVVHQGRPSSIYSTTYEGGTILMKEVLMPSQVWGSSNAYGSSYIKTWLNDTFLPTVDEAVRNAVMQVKIPYRAGSGTSRTVTSGESGFSTEVFLPSCTELGWPDDTYAPKNEGAVFDYFEAGSGTSAAAKRIAYDSTGAARYWYTRSPYCSGSGFVNRIRTDGNYDGGNPSTAYYVRPTFVLPGTTPTKHGAI